MSSFYGGKQGRTYHIVLRYDFVYLDVNDYHEKPAEPKNGDFYIENGVVYCVIDNTTDPITTQVVKGMVNLFQKGGSYADANYGLYVIIDTVLTRGRSNRENGLLYRRGFDYNLTAKEVPKKLPLDQLSDELFQGRWMNYIQRPGGGAIYVGQIVGPEGRSPEVEIESWADFVLQSSQLGNFGKKSSEFANHYTAGKMVDEHGNITYDDDIQVGYINLINSLGDVLGARIAMNIPLLVMESFIVSHNAYADPDVIRNIYFETKDTTPNSEKTYYIKNKDAVGNISYDKLLLTPELFEDDVVYYLILDHPFYYRWDFTIRDGKQGQDLLEITIETGAATGAETDGFGNLIVLDDEYYTYSVRNYELTAEGAVTAHLGCWPYRVINEITQHNKERVYLDQTWLVLELTSLYRAEVGDLYHLEDDLYAVCIALGLTENNALVVLSPQVGDTFYSEIAYDSEEIAYPTIEWQIVSIPIEPFESATVDYKAGSDDYITNLRHVDYITISRDRNMYVTYSDDPKQYFVTYVGDGISSITYLYKNRIEDGILKLEWGEFEAKIGNLYKVTFEESLIVSYYYRDPLGSLLILVDGLTITVTEISVLRYNDRLEDPELMDIPDEDFFPNVITELIVQPNTYFVCIQLGLTDADEEPQVDNGIGVELGYTFYSGESIWRIVEISDTSPLKSLQTHYVSGNEDDPQLIKSIDYITIDNYGNMYVAYSDDPNQYFVTFVGDGISQIIYTSRDRVEDELLIVEWQQLEAVVGNLYKINLSEIETIQDLILSDYYYINPDGEELIEIDGLMISITRISILRYLNRLEDPLLVDIPELNFFPEYITEETLIEVPRPAYLVCIQSGETDLTLPEITGENHIGDVIISYQSVWRIVDLPEITPLKSILFYHTSGESDPEQIVRAIDYITVDNTGSMYVCYSDDPNQYFLTKTNLINSITSDNDGVNFNYTNGAVDHFDLNQILSIDFNKGNPHYDENTEQWNKDSNGHLIFYNDQNLITNEQDSTLRIRYKNGQVDTFEVKRIDEIALENSLLNTTQNITVKYNDDALPQPVNTVPLNFAVAIERAGDNILILYSDPTVRSQIPVEKQFIFDTWEDPVTKVTYTKDDIEPLIWYNYGPLGAQYHVQGVYTLLDLKTDLVNGFDDVISDRMGWLVTVFLDVILLGGQTVQVPHIYAYDYNDTTVSGSHTLHDGTSSHWYEIMEISASVINPKRFILVADELHRPTELVDGGLWFVLSYGHDER